MLFEGDFRVIEALKSKQSLMCRGLDEHVRIRPLLIQGGGLMCGAYGVGASIAMEELGYGNVFTYMVGISSGSPIIAHFAAGTSELSASVLVEDCTNKYFLNRWRFWNQVNVPYLIDIMKNHDIRKVDVERVLRHDSEIFFGVTNYHTALPHLLKPKDRHSFFSAIHASIHMQNISPDIVEVDGIRYVDGGFASPHVLLHAIRVLNPTHILLITNNNKESKTLPISERISNKTLFRHRLSKSLLHTINRRIIARDEALALTRESTIPFAVIWGNGLIERMERSPENIKETIKRSRMWWHALFDSTDV